jgi:hypothetical protein
MLEFVQRILDVVECEAEERSDACEDRRGNLLHHGGGAHGWKTERVAQECRQDESSCGVGWGRVGVSSQDGVGCTREGR